MAHTLVIEWIDNDTPAGSGGTKLTVRVDGKSVDGSNGKVYLRDSLEEARKVAMDCLAKATFDNVGDQRPKV